MSKLLKRGLSVYKIFLKNKIAMSVMMLVSGLMMFVAALQGKGNNTLAMPLGITIAGALITFWSFYRVGYIKANLDKIKDENERAGAKMLLLMQIGETLIYLIVAAVGVYLLLNQSLVNRVLNLMAGGFTTLNGITGVINVVKRWRERDFRWWLKLVLTIVELVLGPYFLICCDTVEGGWFVAMGALTIVAGTIEVITALTPESIRSTMQDGKDIVRILKE
ncbi:DUF308 domain-containing protein [Candidatus Saccharibacteria bacterium]|nr:DUF308 domain-containing protein [Candidatus Saccharibacteria bacterium]MBQ6409651.1 DUF308 domain-containing protein [Candidatus Saccharibacteria bacterium]